MLALILAIAASAAATIASDWRGLRRPLFYAAKPLTTVLVMALAWLTLAAAPAHRVWIMAALACCLVGDVALMSSRKAAFLAGLGSFLVAHLLFALAFFPGDAAGPPGFATVGGALLFLLAVMAYARWLLPRTGRLRGPVLAYLAAITGMVLVAFWRTDTGGAATVLAGALLFAVSDAVLAYRKFVATPWWGQPATLASYYLALVLIAWQV